MKKYKLNARNVFDQVDKLIHQNDAKIIDGADGSLLDHMLYSTKRGYMAFIETYETTNSSTYTMYFSTDINEIYTVWDPIAAAAIE